jgi:hypothetical protein
MAGIVALALGGPAQAGPHANGALIFHLNPDLEYTVSSQGYEGQSGLRDCREAVTEGEVTSERAQIWFVLASFARSPGPVDLAGVEFGFGNYDAGRISFVGYRVCVDRVGDNFLEIPTDGWPGPRQGTSVAYLPPRRTDPVELYWFATYVYGPVSIELGLRPETDMAWFSDPSVPQQTDEAADFGILGFGQPGYNPCAQGPATGACCVRGECRMVTRSECESLGGSYRGDQRDCFPNPCSGTVIETTWSMLKKMYD